MLKLIGACVAIAICASSANARGGGGHVTTFDANLFPGAFIKNLKTDYGASCTGGSDGTAADTWITAASGQSALAVLYIPPGSNCIIDNANHSLTSGTSARIANVVIWAYGATVSVARFGANDAFTANNSQNGNAAIQTATAGASSVTLVSGADATKFSIGDWVCVGALSLQTDGFPPNLQLFEYRTITNIVGSVITINQALANTYKSTYPLTQPNSLDAGPAQLYRMSATWNTNVVFLGAHNTYSAGQVSMIGRNVSLVDVVTDPGIDPTQSDNLNMLWSTSQSFELDKVVSNLRIFRSNIRQIDGQSPGIANLSLVSSTVWTSLNGSGAFNTTLNDSKITFGKVGPSSYGHGGALTVNGGTYSLANANGVNYSNIGAVVKVTASLFTYSNGTFSVTKVSGNSGAINAFAVPGQKYFFADVDGTDNSTPHTVFTVTDVREDASNVYFDTDLGVGVLPSVTCSSVQCPAYMAYPISAAVQAFSSLNFSQLVAP